MNSNNNVVIKSHGFANILLSNFESECYQADHFSFNKIKEIPFFKLLCNINALQLKYQISLGQSSILLQELYVANVELLQSFEKITDLCDDLYATGFIKDIEDSIEQINKYIDNVPFDFFDYDETKEIMDRIVVEINRFSRILELVLNYLRILVDQDQSFIEILKKDLFNQLKNR